MTLTTESIQAAREWFATNALACIHEASTGKVRVNDLPKYISECTQLHEDALVGKLDHTFTFWQRAHFIQTGECVPLLSK